MNVTPRFELETRSSERFVVSKSMQDYCEEKYDFLVLSFMCAGHVCTDFSMYKCSYVWIYIQMKIKYVISSTR